MRAPLPSFIRNLFFLWCFCVLGLAVVPDVSAQRTLIDSQGKEFWLSFLPNFHNYKLADDIRQSDSLYIFITSKEPTTGVITYSNKNGQQFVQSFTITDPTQIYTFRLPDAGFELEGVNNSGRLATNGGQDEQTARQTMHVESEKEVTVYALSQANTTSDAFLVLPVDALGKDYTILAYTSDPANNGGGGGGVHSETPSQFAIVAAEDGTQITITPSARTYRYGTTTQTIILDRGQAYLVQADIRNSAALDLTGTRVVSDKPVAIFAGHQRATIPLNGGGSRDALIEQLPPVETWGQSVFLVPYVQPSDASIQQLNDRFRVMAALDNTEIKLDGVVVAQLAAGGFYEGRLDQPRHMTSSAPVLVAQYKQTAQSDFPNDKLGDPFMMLVPPSEQFMNAYRLISAQVTDEGNGRTYLEQYVTIIAPTSKLGTVFLDGALVNPVEFTPIVTSGYSYASLPVKDGVHSVQADTGIGVFVYGYGIANSYGYVGGTNFTPMDFQAPRLTLDTNCFHLNGLVLDNGRGDSRIELVEFPSDSLNNVRVTLGRMSNDRDSLLFTADLVDPYADGSFSIVSRDSADFVLKRTMRIPGFTVRSALPGSPLPEVQTFEIALGDTVCAEYTLSNNGAFPQSIESMSFARSTPGFIIKPPVPAMIQPGDSVVITLCFTLQAEGFFADTLVLRNPCITRPVLAFAVANQIPDFQAPRLRTEVDCFHLDGVLLEDSRTDSYIDNVVFPPDSMINIVLTPGRTSDAKDSMMFTADLIDPYVDGSFFVIARDSAGLLLQQTVSFPGFTVSSTLGGALFPPLQTPEVVEGGTACVPYMLYNYGAFPQTVTSATFSQATPGFTVSTALPFVIAPGDSAAITLCFTPVGANAYTDTLVIGNNCATREVLAFRIATRRAVATLAMGTARAQAGTTFTIPVRLVQSELLQQSGVTGFRIGLRYNGTILAYRNTDAVEKNRANGVEHIIVDIPAVHKGDSVLARLRFFAGLAFDTVSTLVIDTVIPLGGVAEVVTTPGLFTLDGVCREGGVRLLNPEGMIALMPVRPNPAEGSTQVDIETVETGRTRLLLVNTQGQTVKTLLDGEVPPGVQTLDIDVRDLAGGMYFLLLQTPTATLIQHVEVVR